MQKPIWSSVAATDIGTVRKVNEDDFLNPENAQLWCVADGMGGHSRGDLASQLITRKLAELLSKTDQDPAPHEVINCLKKTNEQLLSIASDQQAIVGSTVAVLMLTEHQAHCIWAGDSRIYRVRNKRIQRLTRDHSQVEDMVDAGLITPEEAEGHPKANVITRAVGASADLELEYKVFDLTPKDSFLLCSDGLNKVFSDDELEYLVSHNTAESLAEDLISKALTRQARDNVTVILVHNHNNIGSDLFQTMPLDSTLPLN